jgi:hypothetical protein
MKKSSKCLSFGIASIDIDTRSTHDVCLKSTQDNSSISYDVSDSIDSTCRTENRFSSYSNDSDFKVLTSLNDLVTANSETINTGHTTSSISHIFDISQLPTSSLAYKPDLPIENFKELKHLVNGSNSNIFQARLLVANKVIILKILVDSIQPSIVALKEFEREISIISRLNHPHILNILGSGLVKSKINGTFMRPFLALEELAGKSLSYHMKLPRHFNDLPFSEIRYLRIAKEFADALYYLHEKFHSECLIIHRDLKPDNIGFNSDGVLKLMDFGLCTAIRKNSTANGVYKLSGVSAHFCYRSFSS